MKTIKNKIKNIKQSLLILFWSGLNYLNVNFDSKNVQYYIYYFKTARLKIYTLLFINLYNLYNLYNYNDFITIKQPQIIDKLAQKEAFKYLHEVEHFLFNVKAYKIYLKDILDFGTTQMLWTNPMLSHAFKELDKLEKLVYLEIELLKNNSMTTTTKILEEKVQALLNCYSALIKMYPNNNLENDLYLYPSVFKYPIKSFDYIDYIKIPLILILIILIFFLLLYYFDKKRRKKKEE